MYNMKYNCNITHCRRVYTYGANELIAGTDDANL